jgi:hypothetical protein
MFFFLIGCEVSRHKILGIVLRPDRTANNGFPAARGPYCSDRDLALLALRSEIPDVLCHYWSAVVAKASPLCPFPAFG